MILIVEGRFLWWLVKIILFISLLLYCLIYLWMIFCELSYILWLLMIVIIGVFFSIFWKFLEWKSVVVGCDGDRNYGWYLIIMRLYFLCWNWMGLMFIGFFSIVFGILLKKENMVYGKGKVGVGWINCLFILLLVKGLRNLFIIWFSWLDCE